MSNNEKNDVANLHKYSIAILKTDLSKVTKVGRY